VVPESFLYPHQFTCRSSFLDRRVPATISSPGPLVADEVVLVFGRHQDFHELVVVLLQSAVTVIISVGPEVQQAGPFS